MKGAVLLLAGGLVLAPAAVVVPVAVAAGSSGAEVCGPAGPARTVTGQHLDPEQLANAATIIGVSNGRRLPARAAVIAVATAMQESSLRILRYGDLDSLGLFQQRASWAPATVRLDPVASTNLFLDALLKVTGWETLPVTVASDRVQHSAYPDAVAAWEPLATALVGTLPSRPAGRGQCPGQGGDGMPGTTGGTSAAGVAVDPSRRRVVVGYALAQLGKPYLWGATGPDAFDCSGLTMGAWAAAGVPIGRTTYSQVTTGVPVTSLAELQPGDLIFIAGSDGTPTRPGHVGMFLGAQDGVPVLVQAPHTGDVVRVTPVSAWTSQVVAIRRPTLTGGTR